MKEKIKFILSTLIIVIGVAIPTYAVQVGGAGHDNGEYGDANNQQTNSGGEETGQVRILAGDTEVEVEFVNTYDDLPIVVLTPMNALFDNLDYVVKDVSNFGFTVEVDHSYLADVDFSWHAFEVEGGMSYASDGTVEEIEVLMVAAEAAEEVAGEAAEADNERGEEEAEEAAEEAAEEEEAEEEEEPVEDGADEEPVEDPAEGGAEDGAAEDTVPAEEPVVEEPVEDSAEGGAEDEAEEEPVAEEETPVEEPVVEEPAVEEPAAEEPVAEEPAVEAPAEGGAAE